MNKDWKEINKKQIEKIAKREGWIKGTREDKHGNKTVVFFDLSTADIIEDTKDLVRVLEKRMLKNAKIKRRPLKIDMFTGRPNRDSIISDNEIQDMLIDLETSETCTEFLTKI